MRFPLNRLCKGAVSSAFVGVGILVWGYAVRPSVAVHAQQQQPGGGGRSGGSERPTGGAAAGPGQGAQAQSADQSHGAATQQAAPFGIVAYPDRPTAPKEVLDRGKTAFSVNCAFCHGSDAGGGSVGPNLLRSEVVLQDAAGEKIMPIVHGARAEQGMPKIDIPDSSVVDIAAWLHSLKTGGNMRSTEKINIVVGKADEGKAAFGRLCASCHSVDGDLKGFAAKYEDPRSMQQAWMLPGVVAFGRRGGGGPPPPQLHVPPTTATVTLASGKKVTGRLGVMDDFYAEIITDDGVVHRFTLNNGVPKVEIHDPLQAHRAMFRTITDKDIHDITAYLESLK
jgi:mono/diheme cytochrome c family protein